MQMDMHLYGVYALARAAGVKPETARTIAYASQFVDDALEDKTVIFGRRAVITSMTSHKPIDYENSLSRDQWNVWASFHFLPGVQPGGQSFEEVMCCSRNSGTADQILQFALSKKSESFGPHLAGVVAHVFADTYSHYGFVGLSSEWNKVDEHSIKLHVNSNSVFGYIKSKLDDFLSGLVGTVAEAIPVGHGSVATLPDRPYLNWEYTHSNGRHVKRYNVDDYAQACERLHDFFVKFVTGNPVHGAASQATAWNGIEAKVKKILELESDMDGRIKAWTTAISSNALFTAVQEDASIGYGDKIIKKWGSGGIHTDCIRNTPLDRCEGYLFHKAACTYRNYVVDDLFPSVGLIA